MPDDSPHSRDPTGALVVFQSLGELIWKRDLLSLVGKTFLPSDIGQAMTITGALNLLTAYHLTELNALRQRNGHCT